MKNIFFYIVAAFFAFSPVKAYSEEIARIDEVSVQKSQLKVSFAVKGAFNKEIEEAIKSGMPTSFTFLVEVDKVSSAWFNEEAGNLEFKHTVKYDTLKEEYEIKFDEAGDKPVRTKDFNEMKRLMTTVSGVLIATKKPFVPGEEHEIRIMAELHTIKLPFLLNYMLFFVKLWDFETGWYTYRFTP